MLADPPSPDRELRGLEASDQEMWKDVDYLCGWKHPRAPRMALLFGDERATRAVLSFLRKTKVGKWSPSHLGARQEEKAPRKEGREARAPHLSFV